MVQKELITRSPLRIFEKSTHGGVGKGNIGIIAAKKGVGKTACLVHIATDKLFQQKHVIHVSFASDTSHIVAWYEDIFEELSRRYKLDCAMDAHNDIIKNRVIMNFKQEGIKAEQVQKSIRSMIRDGHFDVDLVIIDGYDFNKVSIEEFGGFKNFAEDLGIEIWFSATLPKEGSNFDKHGIPDHLSKFFDYISIFILLEPKDGFVRLNLVKDHEISPVHDMHLRLDPQILLIAEDS